MSCKGWGQGQRRACLWKSRRKALPNVEKEMREQTKVSGGNLSGGRLPCLLVKSPEAQPAGGLSGQEAWCEGVGKEEVGTHLGPKRDRWFGVGQWKKAASLH